MCGCKGWVNASSEHGSVSFERDQRGIASYEHGGVSCEHDQGQIPIVMGGREVLQMVA